MNGMLYLMSSSVEVQNVLSSKKTIAASEIQNENIQLAFIKLGEDDLATKVSDVLGKATDEDFPEVLKPVIKNMLKHGKSRPNIEVIKDQLEEIAVQNKFDHALAHHQG